MLPSDGQFSASPSSSRSGATATELDPSWTSPTSPLFSKANEPTKPTLCIDTSDDVMRREPVPGSQPPSPLALGHQRGTLYITTTDVREKRWAHYIIDLNVPLTIIDDSVWENPFAPFTFRLTHDGCEYIVPETLHPHWNEERFRSLICEHQLDVPHYADVVLGYDFFCSHPGALLKVSDGSLLISKLSGPCGLREERPGSEHIMLYLDYIFSDETAIGGIGLYEDIEGGQRFWKTVNVKSASAGSGGELSLLFTALNYTLEWVTTEYPSSKIKLFITPPSAMDIVKKIQKLTVSRSEQLWDTLMSEWAGPKRILQNIRSFLISRRNHATAIEVDELNSFQLGFPDTDEDSKRAVICANILARLGASGNICEDKEREDFLDDRCYLTLGIFGDCFCYYDKKLVTMSLEEVKEYSPRRLTLPQPGHIRSSTGYNVNFTPTKGGKGTGTCNGLQVKGAGRMPSLRTSKGLQSSKWLKMTVSPPASPIKGGIVCRSQLQAMKHDILHEVDRLLQRYTHDYEYHQETLTAQHVANMALLQKATDNALLQIQDQRAQSLAKLMALSTRNFSISSEFKSENIRPRPALSASRQTLAHTQCYSSHSATSPPSAPTSRNVSVYSYQQKSVRSKNNVLQDLQPQPLRSQNLIEMESHSMALVPKTEYEELQKSAKLMTVLADLVNELSMLHDEHYDVPESNCRQHDIEFMVMDLKNGNVQHRRSEYVLPTPTAS